MKRFPKTFLQFSFSAIFILGLGACGKDEDGTRGYFGTSLDGGSVSQQSNTTDGLYCLAQAQKTTVASGESFQVKVTPYQATGTVKVLGFSATESGSSLLISTSYTNRYGTDVIWQPTLTIQDDSGTAKCSFQITVLSNSVRQF